ncbi:MAG TPA: hypothetical protein VM618_04085, partial [Acidimicrobiia bacterium]|nr:hypothetical protein [Acidimicrobiia bacterium]
PAPVPAAASGPLDLDEVVLAWPEALKTLRPRVKGMAREAQPVEIDGGTVVLGLPRDYAALEKGLAEHLPAVAQALGTALGAAPPVVRVVIHDDFLPGRPAGGDGDGDAAAPGPAMSPAPPVATDDDEVEIDDTEPVPEGAGLDSVGLLKDAFGATVEEEA